jgi:chromosome segregation ATPase
MKEIESSTDWETERDELQEKIQKLEAALIEAKEVPTGGTSGELGAEYSIKLREAEQELEDSSEKWRQERRRLNEEIEDLETALRKARTEGRAADVQEAEVTARVQKVEAQADQRVQEASAERERLRDSLEDMKQALAQQESKIDRTELDAIREELLTRVAEAEDARAQLAEEFAASRTGWEEERASLKALIDEAAHTARAGAANLEADLREKLTTEYEWKLKELNFQKEQLEQKLAESVPGPSTSTGSGEGTDSDTVAEIASVDKQLSEVKAFIEDPSAALSKVVRKNVERAELEAYRRGLRFRAGATPPESG